MSVKQKLILIILALITVSLFVGAFTVVNDAEATCWTCPRKTKTPKPPTEPPPTEPPPTEPPPTEPPPTEPPPTEPPPTEPPPTEPPPTEPPPTEEPTVTPTYPPEEPTPTNPPPTKPPKREKTPTPTWVPYVSPTPTVELCVECEAIPDYDPYSVEFIIRHVEDLTCILYVDFSGDLQPIGCYETCGFIDPCVCE